MCFFEISWKTVPVFCSLIDKCLFTPVSSRKGYTKIIGTSCVIWIDSLIFDKIQVKVSFPNQALVDCNATMKKTFLWRVT